jgi:hypothetical protein
MKNGEEGYKIQSTRCLFFKKTDVKAKKEEKLTHKIIQQKNTEANPEKCNCGGFLGQKEAGALLPREKSVIALCVRLLEALAL